MAITADELRYLTRATDSLWVVDGKSNDDSITATFSVNAIFTWGDDFTIGRFEQADGQWLFQPGAKRTSHPANEIVSNSELRKLPISPAAKKYITDAKSTFDDIGTEYGCYLTTELAEYGTNRPLGIISNRSGLAQYYVEPDTFG